MLNSASSRVRQLLKNEELLSGYYSSFDEPVASHLSEEKVEAALRALYRAAGHPTPLVFWLESPFQLTIAPFLLDAVFRWRLQSQLEAKLNMPLWTRCYAVLMEQITDLSAHRLLHGIGPFAFTWEPQNLWTLVGKKLEQIVRKELDSAVYQDMAQKLLARTRREELDPALRRLRNRVPQAATPYRLSHQASTQLQAHLSAMTTRTHRHLRLTPDFAELDRRKFKIVEGTLEHQLIEQLGAETTAKLARELGFAHPDFAPISMEAMLALNSSDRFVEAINSTTWYPPRNNKLLAHNTQPNTPNTSALPAQGAEIIEGWRSLLRYEISFLTTPKACFVCKHPEEVTTDSEGLLHHADRPAMAYDDGYELYSWHGCTIPKWLICEPQRLSVERIEAEQNIEVRRVMIQRFGEARYLRESGALEIARDEFGILFKKEIRGDQPLVMVMVQNSTPEPDGTYGSYFLRVPPNTQTAREGVAWTFNMIAEDYSPTVQT